MNHAERIPSVRHIVVYYLFQRANKPFELIVSYNLEFHLKNQANSLQFSMFHVQCWMNLELVGEILLLAFIIILSYFFNVYNNNVVYSSMTQITSIYVHIIYSYMCIPRNVVMNEIGWIPNELCDNLINEDEGNNWNQSFRSDHSEHGNYIFSWLTRKV